VGFVVLACLSALAALAALAVAVRAELRGRAERLVAATLLWNALIVAPIYALGLTGRLRAAPLGVASLLVSLAVLALSARGIGPGPLLRETGRALVGLLRLPLDALAITWRARSLVFVGVAFLAVLLPYLALSAYLAQPLPRWDPLWYHDTMVGFTIQNHGFQMVDLPDTLQKVNGYVRLGEMTQLWTVIFADRRLADATNLIFAPAIAAAVYAMARRHAGAVIAMGWGVAVVVMPTNSALLQSTYVDPQHAALMLGGILFGTVDSPRLRDTWLAALGLALAIGSKGLALVPVPVAGVVAAVLVLRAHWRGRRGAAWATVGGGVALIALVASATYLRNYLAFHNPLWPDMRVNIDKLHIHWPGLGPWSSAPTEPGAGGVAVNLNEPLPRLLDQIFALPWSVKGMYFDQTVEYGIGIVWVALPLGVAAFVACLVAAVRRARRPATGQATTAGGDPAARPPLAVALILAAMVAGSPALWAPRYHVAAVGLLCVLVAWLTGRSPRDRLGESAVAAVLVTSLMMFWWTPAPRWWYTPAQLRDHARASTVDREVDRDLGAPTPKATGLARERELGPGSLLVFDEKYAAFPSLFWNNHYSNRVMFIHGGPDFLARAAQAGATWIFLNDREPLSHDARAPRSGWDEVGVLNAINGGSAFRRHVGPYPPPPPPPPPAKPPVPAKAAAPSAKTRKAATPAKPVPAKKAPAPVKKPAG
jgi:hypothetical protein